MSTAVVGLIILAGCIVLWVTEWVPAVVTGAIGCLAFVIFKCCDLTVAFSGFASSIVYLLFGALVVGDAMFETGAAIVVGRKVIKWSRNNERLFMFISGAIAGVGSMFMSNNAIIAAFLPIIDSVCELSDKMKRKNLVLNVAICSMLGGACTLVGCTPQLTANALLKETTGVEMKMFTMFAPGVILLIGYLACSQLFGYKLGKKIWGNRPETSMKIDPEKREAVLNAKYDKKKMIIMTVILVWMIIFYITEILPTAVTAMVAALACVITRCTSVKAINKNMDWSTVLFLAFCLGLANALTACGTGELIGSVFTKFIGDASPFVIFAVLTAVSLVISNFITNSTAIIIVLPIGLSIFMAMGYNVMAITMGVYFAASVASSTPMAAAQITLTLVAGYKFTDYAKYTLLHSVIWYVLMLIFIPIFFPLGVPFGA